MSSLVAYNGSSDEEDSEMDTQPGPYVGLPIAAPRPTTSSSSAGSSKARVGTATVTIEDDGDEEEEESLLYEDMGDISLNTSHLKLESVLPLPTGPRTRPQKGAVETGPIPPKKVYGDEEELKPRPSTFPNLKTTKSAKGTVQISIPSLKNLETEDDEGYAKRKIFPGSLKGCGLFALLPEPKNDTLFKLGSLPKPIQNNGEKPGSTNDNSQPAVKPTPTPLIPRSLGVKRAASANQRLVAKYMKQESNFRIVSRSASTAAEANSNAADDSDEDEDAACDFFSLDAGNEKFEPATPGLSSAQSSIQVNIHPEVEEYVDPNAVEMEALPPPFEHKVQTVDTDLMKFIHPKKKGREIPAGINIIDVSADDLRPQTTDWLKTITDTSIIPPRKAVLPGGMTKRKHQITYLAAEAKAREEELQNQWASNRQARRPTQNKYGF